MEERNPLAYKTEFITTFCEKVSEGDGLDAQTKSLIDRAVRTVYKDFLKSKGRYLPPLLGDFRAALQKMNNPRAEELALSLERFVDGALNTFSKPTNLVQQVLTRTVSDTFYITAKDEDGFFCLYYHPAEVEDSQKMQEVKTVLRLPDSIQYDRGLCYEGAGWAGPISWDLYGGALGVADQIEYYLTDMHTAIQYYITEPEPGVFYLLYGE